MKSYLPEYSLTQATTLEGALEILNTQDILPFAGGTDIMVLLDAGKLSSKNFLDINSLDSLKLIEEVDDNIFIGALCTFSDIRENTFCQKYFPMMCEAGRWSGAKAIQNRGTIGGNICNASPAGDTPPALLCYDAQVELSSAEGVRWLSYHDFHLDYKKLAKKPNELVTRIKIPKTNSTRFEHYEKVGTRLAQAISKICFSGLIDFNEDKSVQKIRLAWGAMGPYVLRSIKTETILINQVLSDENINAALLELSKELIPIGDIRSTAKYRSKVAQNLLKHFLYAARDN